METYFSTFTATFDFVAEDKPQYTTGKPKKARPIVNSSQQAYDLLKAGMVRQPYERFVALFLNQRGELLRKVKVSEGGVTATTVDAKRVFREALKTPNCVGIVLCHNHPSGSLQPSQEDIRITGWPRRRAC